MSDQDRCLDWLSEAHAQDAPELAGRLARALRKGGCNRDQIRQRGHSFPFEDHALRTAGTAERTRRFAEVADAYFMGAYAGEDLAPDELVHVTCTGYVSPSGAQKLVAARGWKTRVTHAYQMGCYAAIPALRIAQGSLATDARRVDVVHTELCSLHVDTRDHRLEQLVVQTLFADGLIRYSALRDGNHGLAVRALHEQIVPASGDAMAWVVGDSGMHMTLARDVPERIAGALRPFVLALLARAGCGLDVLRHSIVAVHPGGPKIIDSVRDVLELSEAQVAASRAVLREHGNMSSATLPHIWMELLADPRVAPGTLIPSLAFGPGLTLCGAVLEKR